MATQNGGVVHSFGFERSHLSTGRDSTWAQRAGVCSRWIDRHVPCGLPGLCGSWILAWVDRT